MTIHLALASVPVTLVLLVRVLRDPQPKLPGLAREILNLIALRIVLRDSEPKQRGDLLAAHRDWRAESPHRRPGPVSHRPSRRPAARTRPRS